jgi:hypothetical protein
LIELALRVRNSYLFRVTTFVRVFLNGNLSEGFLDLVLGGLFSHTQKIIVLLVINFLFLSTRTASSTHEMF